MYKSATATCKNIHESPTHNANKQVKQRLILLHNSILYKSPKTSFKKSVIVFKARPVVTPGKRKRSDWERKRGVSGLLAVFYFLMCGGQVMKCLLCGESLSSILIFCVLSCTYYIPTFKKTFYMLYMKPRNQ